jgi:hypothetical protein
LFLGDFLLLLGSRVGRGKRFSFGLFGRVGFDVGFLGLGLGLGVGCWGVGGWGIGGVAISSIKAWPEMDRTHATFSSLASVFSASLEASYSSAPYHIYAFEKRRMERDRRDGGHTFTGSGAVSAGAEAEDSSAGADPEAREAFVACPFSKASLNRLASGISVFSFVSPILPLGGKKWE